MIFICAIHRNDMEDLLVSLPNVGLTGIIRVCSYIVLPMMNTDYSHFLCGYIFSLLCMNKFVLPTSFKVLMQIRNSESKVVQDG